MSNSYHIIFNTNKFPTNAEIEAFARSIDSSFRLDASFNFLEDKGFCPCKYKRRKQGFEWDCTIQIDKDINVLGEVIFRSDNADAICAVLVAMSIAFLSNGGIQLNSKLLLGRDLLIFAKDEIAAYTNQLALEKKRCKNTPDESLLLVIEQLKNVKVRQLVQVDKDMSEPLISVVFPNNSRLMGKRWTLTLIDGFIFTTQDLPVYRLSNAQMDDLKNVVCKIRTIIMNDHILDINFDSETLDISINFATGILTFHPKSTYKGKDIESEIFLNINQKWEFLDQNRQTILPDPKLKKLTFL